MTDRANNIFYSLSFAVILIALTIMAGLHPMLSLFIWLLLTAVVFLDSINLSNLPILSSLIHPPKSTLSDIPFAAINNPVAASLASQLTSDMTIEQIEHFVTDRPSHQGIHARLNKIER